MNNPILDPFPILKTERLHLREMTIEDAESMHGLRSNREIMRLLDRPLTQNIDDAARLIETIFESQQKGTAIMWAMALKGESIMIGCICLVRINSEHRRSEVGFLLDPEFHRQGLMGEALDFVIQFGFDKLGFHKITASTNPQNAASIGLLEKHGFEREASFRQHYLWNGRFIDSVEMARFSPAAELAIQERMLNPILDVHA